MKKIMIILLFILNACSASMPKIVINLKNDAQIKNIKSYYLYPLQIGPTLANSNEIYGSAAKLENKIKEILISKGYQYLPAKDAQCLVSVSIETDTTGAAREEDLRMLKGVHKSNFPDANPRIRKLEADYLKIEISNIDNNSELYKAKCRLSDNNEQTSELITPSDAEYCIAELLNF